MDHDTNVDHGMSGPMWTPSAPPRPEGLLILLYGLGVVPLWRR
ncbi:hypothetical protein [Nocardiopsis deserti]|nr:hypothetical protein [Nocardiopsis deserti]